MVDSDTIGSITTHLHEALNNCRLQRTSVPTLFRAIISPFKLDDTMVVDDAHGADLPSRTVLASLILAIQLDTPMF
jgi:hypothetical protein